MSNKFILPAVLGLALVGSATASFAANKTVVGETKTDSPTSSTTTITPCSPHSGKMLKWADKDGDGKISQDEFKDALDKKFNKIDANDDGTVTREEFDTYIEKKFTKIDANGDGFITVEEIQAAHSSKNLDSDKDDDDDVNTTTPSTPKSDNSGSSGSQKY